MSKAIIFDMDGTLFQTNLILEPALEATFEVLRKENLWDKKTPIEQYRGNYGCATTGCIGNTLPKPLTRNTSKEQ